MNKLEWIWKEKKKKMEKKVSTLFKLKKVIFSFCISLKFVVRVDKI